MRLLCYFYNSPQSTHSCFQHLQSACLKARCRAWPKGLVQHSSAPNDAKPPIINYRFSKSFLNELSHSINKAYYIISKRSVNKNFKNIPESVWWNHEFGKLLVGDPGLEPRRTGSKPALLTNYSNPHQMCSTEFYSEKAFKLANGGSEWERSTASGFSVPCTTTNYTTDPLKQIVGLIAIEITTSWSSGHAKVL